MGALLLALGSFVRNLVCNHIYATSGASHIYGTIIRKIHISAVNTSFLVLNSINSLSLGAHGYTCMATSATDDQVTYSKVLSSLNTRAPRSHVYFILGVMILDWYALLRFLRIVKRGQFLRGVQNCLCSAGLTTTIPRLVSYPAMLSGAQ